ncbi:MAG: TRAP transporter small permease [Alphaproteobacteria bacterium]|nr:TRAP transporter small permease [Alphaproteobacteria bacterium]
MRSFFTVYDRAIDGLALIAAVALALVFASIVIVVGLRTVGIFRGADVAFALTEYAMLYIGTLGAPWLLREKGHICIEVVRGYLSPRGKYVLAKVAYAIGALVSVLVAVFVIRAMETNWNEWEMRAFKVHKQWLLLPVGVSFGLVAVGFLRLLGGHGTIYEDSSVPIPDKGL